MHETTLHYAVALKVEWLTHFFCTCLTIKKKKICIAARFIDDAQYGTYYYLPNVN